MIRERCIDRGEQRDPSAENEQRHPSPPNRTAEFDHLFHRGDFTLRAVACPYGQALRSGFLCQRVSGLLTKKGLLGAMRPDDRNRVMHEIAARYLLRPRAGADWHV
jgi:hypothetical protein